MARYKKKSGLSLYRKHKKQWKAASHTTGDQTFDYTSPEKKRFCNIQTPRFFKFTLKRRCITLTSSKKTPKRRCKTLKSTSVESIKFNNKTSNTGFKKKLDFSLPGSIKDADTEIICDEFESELIIGCSETFERSNYDTNGNSIQNSDFQDHEIEREVDGTIKRLKRLIKAGKFSTSSISYKLFDDTLKWYDTDNTSSMRYSEETKEFFWTGKRLLGGQFIRFMRGFTHEGQVKECKANLGFYNPEESDINLPVPSDFVLKHYQPRGVITLDNVEPGIIHENLDLYGSTMSNSSFAVMFDGKKIIPQSADVYLLDQEEPPKLSEISQKHESYMSVIQGYKDLLNYYIISDISDINGLVTDSERHEYIQKSLKVIHVFSKIVKELRVIYCKKALYLQTCARKLTETNDGKYKYISNKVKTIMYQISISTKGLLESIDTIAGSIASVNGKSLLYKKEQCNLTTQSNYLELREDIINGFENISTEYIKQRSQAWFALRNTVKVTGSVAHTSIGLDTLMAQKKYFDSKFGSKLKESEPVTKEAKEAMEHGSRNEINAIATLVSKIVPVYYPEFKFYEEGAYVIRDENGDSLMVVSPDGTLRNGDKIVSVEIKCPYSKFVGNTPVFYELKQRHALQCLLEADVTNAMEHLYISWSKESTTVMRIKPRKDVVNGVIQEVKNTYYAKVPMRPTKISNRAKELKCEIQTVLDEAEFLGEFPSVICNSSPRTDTDKDNENDLYYHQHTDQTCYQQCITKTDTLTETAYKGIKHAEEAFQYQKPIASEVLVYLISDMDRSWHRELGHGLPVAYLFKGYSLTIPTSRRILDTVLNACKEHNVHTPCTAFDGQFFKLKDYDENNVPLTKFAMHRKVWTEIKKMTKKELIEHIDSLFKDATYDLVTDVDVCENGFLQEKKKFFILYSSNPSCMPVTTAFEVLKRRKNNSDKQTTNSHESVNLTDTSEMNECILEVFASMTTDGDDDEIYNQLETESCVLSNDVPDSEQVEIDQDTTDAEEQICPVVHNTGAKLETLDYENILQLLKTKRTKWEHFDINRLVRLFQSPTEMNREFINEELNKISNYLTTKLLESGIVIRKSIRKAEKINKLCSWLGLHSHLTIQEKKKRHKCVDSLQSLCRKELNKKMYPKEALAVSYARCMWPSYEKDWITNSAVNKEIVIHSMEDDTDIIFEPVYSPEYSLQRKQLEVRVMDGTHIRTNIRSKLIRHGLSQIKVEAWKKVAESGKTHLRPAMLELRDDGKILHQQSDPYVRTMFCEEVEKEMQTNGNVEEARFCRLFRRWHEAEDLPGIPAIERCIRSIELRQWLMEGYDFTSFPPLSQYVKGIPRVTFEGLVCSIDAHILLYKLVKGATYNWRSVSTLVAENFMGELAERAMNSDGVPSGQDLASDMCKISQLHAMRLKPDRSFKMKTAKSRRYETPDDVELVSEEKEESADGQVPVVDCPISYISVRDHKFDRRKPHSVKLGKVSRICEVPRGVHSVRTHYKVDESKMLPSLRMGIKENELPQII